MARGMDTSEWPLRRFNLFAIPVAIAMAILSDSFWRYLGITAGVGLGIAYVMAALSIGKFKDLTNANPLLKLSAEVRGANDPSLHIRFIFMQSLSGAIIIAFWFTIASGIVYLFR